MKLAVRRRLSMLSMLLSLSVLPLGGCSMLPTDPGNLYDLRREAQAAYEGSEDARAEKLLLGLARAVPNDAETWFYLGNLYARSNRPDEAVHAYQKSLMLNRRDPRAWHNLGVVRLREAWAAFIQAHGTAALDDPLYAKTEAVISAMEKIPLEGMNHSEAKAGMEHPTADATKDTTKDTTKAATRAATTPGGGKK